MLRQLLFAAVFGAILLPTGCSTTSTGRHGPGAVDQHGASPAPKPDVVQRNAVVRGCVVDWDGNPIRGAQVSGAGNWKGVLTDAHGRFELSGVEAGECDITVQAYGFHCARFVTTALDADCRLLLVPLPVARLRVVDKLTAQPVKVEAVAVDWSSFYQFDQPPDEQVLVALPGSGVFSLTVFADGYAPETVDAVRALDGELLDGLLVEMTEGTTLLLNVVDRQTGLPVENARIKNEGETDARGQCSIEHLEPGLHEFDISHPAFALQVITVETNRLDPTKEVTVTLDPGLILRGRVLSKRTGAPLEDAWISLRKDDIFTSGNTARGLYSTRSQPDGTFSFRLYPDGEERLAPGRYTLDVSHDNYAPIHTAITLDGDSKRFLPLALEDGLCLSGSIKTRDGTPASHCSVGLTCMERPYFRTGHVGSDGTYEIAHLIPGTYEVEIERWPALDVSYLAITKDTRADFVVGGAAIHGVITAADMRRYPDSLFVESQQQHFLWRGTRVRSTYDEDGAFRVEHLPPGAYTIGLDTRAMDGPDDALVRDIVLKDEDLPVDAADDVDWLRGTVRTESGRPAVFAGVELIAQPPTDRVEALIREFHAHRLSHAADAQGHFDIDCVPPGSHYLLLSKGGYATRAVPVIKKPSEDLTGLDVVLEPSCVLVLDCKKPDNPVPDGFWLAVLDSQGRPLVNGWVHPDGSTGEVLITSLGPGRYQIVAKGPDHAVLRKSTILVRGVVNREQLDFQPGHTLDVIVVDQNSKPVPLAEVVLDTGDDVALSAELIRRMGVMTTNAQGRTTLEHVADGTCTVRVLGDGYQHAEQRVRVPGRDALAVVTLQPVPSPPTTPPPSSPTSSA